VSCWGSYLTPTVMPIYLGAPMDENPLGVGPSVIFTATYEISGFPGQTVVEASAILQARVLSNGFKRLTLKSAKSATLRVTTVNLWTMAVAAIMASS